MHSRAGLAVPLLFSIGCGRIDTNIGAEVMPEASPPPVLVTSVYMEAESGALVGFTILSDPTASGGEYIFPPPNETSLSAPGTANAQYDFVLGSAGSYLLWGRIQAPGAENNTFFVTLDQQPTVRWQLSTGVAWYWGVITSGTDYTVPVTYQLGAGSHHLVIQNSEPRVALDKLFIGPAGVAPDLPPDDTLCNPPNSIQAVDGGCVPSCGSHGATTCGAAGCIGQTLLPSYDCVICCIAPEGGVADASDGGPAEDGAPTEAAARDAQQGD